MAASRLLHGADAEEGGQYELAETEAKAKRVGLWWGPNAAPRFGWRKAVWRALSDQKRRV